MSKSLEDYREIVKVLKLQLLKVREQNNTLAKTLGVATESDISSFTPRLEKYKNNSKQIAKHLYLFNLYAHKCQLIGVSPEMVFRIADKKRDKKVAVSSMSQIMKRLKLRLDDTQISRLLGSITKSGHIFYQQYLQYLSAFQINTQPYPQKGQRNYSQICLLKLAQQSKQKYQSVGDFYKQISNRQSSGPQITFQTFSIYCKRNTTLKDVEIVCAFIALDTESLCLVEKDFFNRQMNKIYGLIQKGVSYEDEYKPDIKRKKSQQQISQTKQKNKNRKKQKEDNQFTLTQETGAEAGNKAKKQTKKQIKLNKNELTSLLKKQGISVSTLIIKLLQKQQQRKLIRPFGLYDFYSAVNVLNKSINKKNVLKFFKCLDVSGNGSVSTDQLVKLWLQGRQQLTDSSETLFKLLKRHLKQIQSEQTISKFTMTGHQSSEVVTYKVLGDAFEAMRLDQNYLKLIEGSLPSKCTVQKLVQILQTGGVKKSTKMFEQMKKVDFQNMNVIIKKLVPKQNKNFPKLSRLEDEQEDSTTKKDYWQTIFTNQWACWSYCLQVASKLTTYWRDHQFGPTKGDPHGFRSIVGNQSQIPPGMPMQDEITWLTFEEYLQKNQNKKDQVKLFTSNLQANDIVQGNVGDCWLVSAISIITSNDQFIKGKDLQKCKKTMSLNDITYGLHPIIFHFFRRFGIYVFKFYKGFKPVYVLVDELFPAQISSNKLIFAKSPDPGLQWVAFVQKAYAKLHHCYSNLISGEISQGLADMTNCLPIKQDLSQMPPQQILKKIMKLAAQNQLMGCSITPAKKGGVESPVTLEGEKTGLFYGHAYSINDLIKIKPNKEQQFKLLRVRNPWGHGQWALDWSDNPQDPDYASLDKYQKEVDTYYDQRIKKAKQMRENYDQIVKYTKKQDGQFLIKFQDFIRCYNNLFTGYAFKDKQYIGQKFQGKWDNQMPSGICKTKGTQKQRTKFVKDNYQFIMKVDKDTDVLMLLIQQDGRLYRGEKYPYKEVCNGLIILVFNLDEKQMKIFDVSKMVLPTLKVELKREVNYWHKFKQGRYAIFPCKMANQIPQSQFEFRVYSQNPVTLTVRGEKGGQFKPIAKQEKSTNPGALSELVEVIEKNLPKKK